MSDGVTVTFVMNLKPEVMEPLLARFEEALPDTRAFPGCRSVKVFRNDEDPNKIILLEEWDSREDHEKYMAWRNEDGTMDALAGMFTSPTKPEYWPTLVA
jgi:quinol monooxygenase YgiN